MKNPKPISKNTMNMQTLHFSTFFNVHDHGDNSDDTDEQRDGLIDERKQRRMVSNRESARRSRMRKQKHLNELWSQALRLRTENHSLMDKLNRAVERHEHARQENAQLKEETCDLRRMVSDLQMGSPFRDLQHIGYAECSDRGDAFFYQQ